MASIREREVVLGQKAPAEGRQEQVFDQPAEEVVGQQVFQQERSEQVQQDQATRRGH
jgi:hypothetical protein